jgi:glycosyltransferase involved in cell wall biosynthesis
MRLGAVWEPEANAHYRAIDPMSAMARRGHDVVWPPDDGSADLSRLIGCDAVHVYRRAAEDTQRVLAELARRGTAITYDNDDDFTAVPKQSPLYKRTGGFAGQRIFAETARLARAATRFTTTNETLAQKYRRAGAERVEVIDNYLAPDVSRVRRSHDGLVIGWIAGAEHRADADRIRIGEALERLLAKHEAVRVECIGVNLGLSERYRHDRLVRFLELPARIAGWDIGIAPLADLPYNETRSGIKLKEYAGSGVPWLASPVGPYRGLGEAHGGRLVPDDGWFEALDRLVARARERRRLARKAKAWAKRQTINTVAGRWEQVFETAAAAGTEGAPGIRPRTLARPGRRARAH